MPKLNLVPKNQPTIAEAIKKTPPPYREQPIITDIFQRIDGNETVIYHLKINTCGVLCLLIYIDEETETQAQEPWRSDDGEEVVIMSSLASEIKEVDKNICKQLLRRWREITKYLDYYSWEVAVSMTYNEYISMYDSIDLTETFACL